MSSLLLPLLSAALLDSTCASPAQRVDAAADAPCVAAVMRLAAPDDTTQPRRRAVQVSDAYARRLTIHRYASYTLPPLFVGQFLLGNKLIHQKEDLFAGRRRVPVDKSLRNAHVATAIGVGALFTVNTVTGLWNLHDSWGNTEGRALRTTHALLMLASDAGFAATGALGRQAYKSDVDKAKTHRAVGLSSMGVATVAASLMWFRK